MPTSGSSSGTPASSSEPVSLAEAKLHLRVDHDDEDDLIQGLIEAAREKAETFTRRRLLETTEILELDRFPLGGGAIKLPWTPLVSVTSITYLDADGDSQTLDSASYRVVADKVSASIALEYDYSWPGTRAVPAAVRVTYVAGFGASASDVPRAIRQGMLLLIAHWYENREAVAFNAAAMPLPLGVESLFYTQRVYEFS